MIPVVKENNRNYAAMTRVRHHPLNRYRVIYLTLIGILFYSIFSRAQDSNMLRSILTIKAPVVKENKMIYTFNIIFKECPEGNWWYYDSSNMRMIIEFYDAYVNVGHNINIKGQMPVTEIEVKNVTTTIVPSGKKSQIVLHIKKQMHAEAYCLGDTMRVVLWKDIEQKSNARRKKVSLLYLLPVIAALITGFLLVSFLPLSSEKP
jgi:hypothetical protein